MEAKTRLRACVYSKLGKQRISRRIHQWQHELVLVLNKLELQPMPEQLKSMIRNALTELGRHLEEHYPRYFDQAAAMPHCLALQIYEQIERELPLLRAVLRQRKVPEALAVIILHEFEQLEYTNGFSPQQWHYWQGLCANLTKFCKDINNEELQILLQEHLIYLRFDSPTLYLFLKTQLKLQLEVCYQPEEQYDLLCAIKKRLIQQQEHQAYQQQQLGLSLREMLLDFVLAELSYLQRRQPVKEQHHAAVAEPYRVSLGISVDSLAYLLKLSISVGLINASPKSTFLQFVSQHFQTPGIGEAKISVNSLNAKYKQVVQHTAIKVRALLRKMIKQIESDFELA